MFSVENAQFHVVNYYIKVPIKYNIHPQSLLCIYSKFNSVDRNIILTRYKRKYLSFKYNQYQTANNSTAYVQLNCVRYNECRAVCTRERASRTMWHIWETETPLKGSWILTRLSTSWRSDVSHYVTKSPSIHLHSYLFKLCGIVVYQSLSFGPSITTNRLLRIS